MVFGGSFERCAVAGCFDLGVGSRMNVPGRAGGNWRWRVTEEMLSTTAFEWLRELTERSKRCSSVGSTAQPVKAE